MTYSLVSLPPEATYSIVVARFKDGYDNQKGRFTTHELPIGACKFPIDCIRRGKSVIPHCGIETKEGSIYCEEHHLRCYNIKNSFKKL